jgi:hypothetical protein
MFADHIYRLGILTSRVTQVLTLLRKDADNAGGRLPLMKKPFWVEMSLVKIWFTVSTHLILIKQQMITHFFDHLQLFGASWSR